MNTIEFFDEHKYIIPTYEWKFNKNGNNIDIYFDAFDILSAIAGINNLYIKGEFNKEQYERKEWLVFSLFLNGFLPTVKLLEPHNSELVSNIKRNSFSEYPFAEISDPNSFISRIANSLSIPEKYISSSPNIPENWDFENQDIAFDELFKFYSLVHPINWEGRFQQVFVPGEHSKVIIDKIDLDLVINEIDDNLFAKCLKGFNSFRGTRYRSSNINDSIALTILATKLDLFRESKGALPVFFDGTGLFSKVIEEQNLESYFSYFNQQLETEISVIKSADYFISLALIYPNEKLLEKGKSRFPIYYDLKNYDPLENLFNPSYPIKESIIFWNKVKEIDDLSIIRIELQNSIKNVAFLENHWFFINVWIPYIANNVSGDQNSFNLIISNQQYLEELAKSKSFFAEVQNAWDDYFVSVKRIQLFSTILSNLFHRIDDKHKYKLFNLIKSSNDQRKNVFRDYGLIRFSLQTDENNKEAGSDEYRIMNDKICGLLYDQFASDDITIRNKAVYQLIKYIYKGFYKQSILDRSIAAALLWILEDFTDIDELCADFEEILEYPHYSIALVHCAAILQISSGDEDLKRIDKIIDCICFKVGVIDSYHIDLGRAFIYYRIWFERHQYHFSGGGIIPDELIRNPDIYLYLQKAIELSRKAYLFLVKDIEVKYTDRRVMSYLYSLNLFIFSTTEGGSTEEFKKLVPHVDNFIIDKRKYENNYWESRYDDTLARYYFRMALELARINIKNNSNNYILYMREARKAIDRAISNSIDMHFIKESFSQLLSRYEGLNMEQCNKEMNKTISNLKSDLNIK